MDDNLAFFVSSLLILAIYTIALIACLVAVRSQFHTPAIVMTSAYLLSFSTKAASDGLRYFLHYQLVVTQVCTVLSCILILLAAVYLSFIVTEVALKLKSDSYQDYRKALASFNRRKTLLYLAIGFVAMTDYAIYLVYLFFSGEEPAALRAVQVALKAAQAGIDLYLTSLFVRAVHFMQAIRLDKLEEHQ